MLMVKLPPVNIEYIAIYIQMVIGSIYFFFILYSVQL